MREEIQKLLKLESQINKDLSKIETARRKLKNVKLHDKEKKQLETLLTKTADPSLSIQDIDGLKQEFQQIRRQLRDAVKQNKGKARVERALRKDLQAIAKKEKKQALLLIHKKLEQAEIALLNSNDPINDEKLNEMKQDIGIDFKINELDAANNDDILNSQVLEDILNRITKQASFKSQISKNEIIKDVGSRKLNNKFCLPIVNSFTNAKDLIKYLSENSRINYNENGNERRRKVGINSTYCFELVRIIAPNEKEREKCNLLLSNSNEWISKGEIWVNNELRSKLRELFLSDKFKNEQCPLAIRKFYADTYFGGKYSLYGKNICQIKSICYRSIVESFRDEAISKISKDDKDFMFLKFANYTIFDPFAGTGNWALQMSKLLKSNNTFVWEIEKNIFQTIIENNENNKNLHAFNHSFEIIPQSAIDYVSNVSKHALILLSPPWGKAFKPGIGIDLTEGIFPIINLLKFYEKQLVNVKKAFAIQVDKNICNFGNILQYYNILLRNDHLLIIEAK